MNVTKQIELLQSEGLLDELDTKTLSNILSEKLAEDSIEIEENHLALVPILDFYYTDPSRGQERRRKDGYVRFSLWQPSANVAQELLNCLGKPILDSIVQDGQNISLKATNGQTRTASIADHSAIVNIINDELDRRKDKRQFHELEATQQWHDHSWTAYLCLSNDKYRRLSKPNIVLFLRESPELQELRKETKRKPSDAAGWLSRALAHAKLRQFGEAVEAYTCALESGIETDGLFVSRGECYLSIEQNDKARNDFCNALSINPNNANALLRRGEAQLKMGERNGAIADFSAAINLRPGFDAALLNRGLAYIQAHRFTDAQSDLNRCIDLTMNNAQAYKARGEMWLALGDIPKAIEDLDMAISIDPKYSEAIHLRSELQPKNQLQANRHGSDRKPWWRIW